MAVDFSKLFELKGKTGVITGGSGSICGTIAEHMAHNGVHIIVLDSSVKPEDEKKTAIGDCGGSIEYYNCNVLDESRLNEISREVIETWGVPDFLINGAGGNHPSGSTTHKFADRDPHETGDFRNVFDLEFDSFRSVLDLNFLGTFLPVKVFGREMSAKGQGVIINISSMSGIIPLTKVAAYSAAKAAVINFTKWLAVHLAHTGLRVNTIAPGFVSTEQSRFLQYDAVTGELNDRGKEIINSTPMNRFGESEELLGTVVWLLSEASRFVTGVIIPVDGGFSSYSI